jgi:pleiotropic regulator 1
MNPTCSIKKWKCPEGTFVHNFPGHEAIINTLSVNEDGVLFSGGEYIGWTAFVFCANADMIGDNGSLSFWDYKTGKPFQHLNDIPQSGSLDSEAVCSSSE